MSLYLKVVLTAVLKAYSSAACWADSTDLRPAVWRVASRACYSVACSVGQLVAVKVVPLVCSMVA